MAHMGEITHFFVGGAKPHAQPLGGNTPRLANRTDQRKTRPPVGVTRGLWREGG